MRPRYETESDRRSQRRIISVVERAWGCKAHKCGDRFVADYYLTKGSRACWAEVKHRYGMRWGQYDTIMLSTMKVRRLQELSTATSLSWVFVVADRSWVTRYAKGSKVIDAEVRLSGRSRRRRDRQDVEYCHHIPLGSFVAVRAR